MNEILKVLICDDEPGMRLILRKILEKDPAFRVVGEAADGQETLALFEELQPDVVFLDIDMPRMNGVEVARRISDIRPDACLIFATAHEGYRREAFEVYAFDYLLKPFSLDRVDETLDRIRLSRSLRQVPRKDLNVAGKVMIHYKDGIAFVDKSEILLLQREERMTVVYTKSESYQTSESLSEWLEKLDSPVFLRCHKSYVINVSAVTHIYPYGRWTYVVKLRDIPQDALMTADKFQELEEYFQ